MLGDSYKVVIIDEAHMMFDRGRGCLMNELVCLSRCLDISVMMLTGKLRRGEWRHLTVRMSYKPYVDPCIRNRVATTSIAYARPRKADYCKLLWSRKRKYPQLRRTYAQNDWDTLLRLFGTYAFAHDRPEGVVVLGIPRQQWKIWLSSSSM
jgi:hypothetical protein